eukprot:gene8539-363_t
MSEKPTKRKRKEEVDQTKKKKIQNIVQQYENSKKPRTIEETKKISKFDEESRKNLIPVETKKIIFEEESPVPPNAFSNQIKSLNFSKAKKHSLKENLEHLTKKIDEQPIELVDDESSEDEENQEVVQMKFKDTPNYVATNLKRKFKRFKTLKTKTPKNVLSLKQLEDLMSSEDEKEDNFEDGVIIEDCNSSENSDSSEDENSEKEEDEVISDDEMLIEEFETKSNFSSLTENDEEMNKILKSEFGFDSFRFGQKETIKRIISDKSTLLIQSTGSGKSLCYQYSAFVLPYLTLVITPLISLMNDQLSLLPSCLTGGSLYNSQSYNQKKKVYEDVKNGKIKVLFISPERLNNDRFIELVQKEFPPISFACIDEVHCVSQWSHNFRPSYLHLKNLLQNKLGVKTILGLTATATHFSEKSICDLLNIPKDGVIRAPLSRENLNLTISKGIDKYQDVVNLLNSDRFKKCSSIIIYTMLRNDADSLSNYLNVNGFESKSYHAGLTSSERTQRQKSFISKKTRIIVATVAFGMGINAKSVSAVIHFSLPRSLEDYTQEVGRAGRDGQQAECHMFFNDDDYKKLRSLTYSNGVDLITVKQLLMKIFQSKETFMSFSINKFEMEFDMKREILSTILVTLEVDYDYMIRLLPTSNQSYELNFMKSTPDELSSRSDLIKTIIENSKTKTSSYVFNITKICSKIGLTVDQIEDQLNELKEKGEVKYQSTDESFFIEIKRKPEILIDLAKEITEKLKKIEESSIFKLFAIYKVSQQFSNDTSTSLKISEKIEQYFNSQKVFDVSNLKIFPSFDEMDPTQKSLIQADIKALINQNENTFKRGRQIARIFHGISSPYIQMLTSIQLLNYPIKL